MVNCTINNISIPFAASWDELHKKQLYHIIGMFNRGITEIELKIQTALKLIGARVLLTQPAYRDGSAWHKLRIGKQTVWLSEIQLHAISQKLSYLTSTVTTKEGMQQYTIDSSLTVNLFDQFRLGLTMYYGPAEKLFNITFEEYITAETNYMRYSQTQNAADLDKLVATLYRPKNKAFDKNALHYNGDIRQPYNDHLVDERVARFSKLDPIIKTGIMLYYQGCRKFLAVQFPDVFKPAASGQKSTLPGMLGLVDALACDDVTKVESIRKSMLYDVMIHLQQAAERKERSEAEMKKMKQKH